MDDFGHTHCWSCGLVFDLDDIDDMDDVRCPDCNSQDVGGSDELE